MTAKKKFDTRNNLDRDNTEETVNSGYRLSIRDSINDAQMKVANPRFGNLLSHLRKLLLRKKFF